MAFHFEHVRLAEQALSEAANAEFVSAELNGIALAQYHATMANYEISVQIHARLEELAAHTSDVETAVKRAAQSI